MDESYSVVQHTPSKDGTHILDCSCSCGGPNVSVSNVHSTRRDGQKVVVLLRNDALHQGQKQVDE